jgi:hypothetical protein
MSTKNKKIKIVVTILLTLLSAASICSYLLLSSRSTTTVNNTDISTKSLFSFTGADGWRQGPTDKTSMALFSKARQDGTSACFTSAELKQGIANKAAELTELQNNLKTTGGQVVPLSSSPSVLHTTSGDHQYELQQYRIDGGNGSKDAMKGLALGYVQLNDSYVILTGHCETTEELTTITQALHAYKLDK